MTTRHTPGPWLLEGTTVYALVHDGWRKGVETFRNRFYLFVQADRECPPDEILANARLIAAAPEMLEALKKIRRELIASGNWNAQDEDWPANRGAVSSAILKAEGR